MFDDKYLGGGFYGNFICKTCCRDMFFENNFKWHKHGYATGFCRECDFPVGAIIWVNKEQFIANPSEYVVIDSIAKEKTCTKKDYHVVNARVSHFQYYNFEWHWPSLKLKPRSLGRGIDWLVLIQNKLPTRLIFTLEDILTLPPLDWYDFERYFWPQTSCEQHFDKEKWMDQAPIILSNNYVNVNNNSIEQSEHSKRQMEYLLIYINKIREDLKIENQIS